MTMLDERARAAAQSLRAAVEAHTVAEMVERPNRRRKRRMLVVVAAAALVAALAAGMAVIARTDEEPVTSAAAPVVRDIAVARGAQQIAVAPEGDVWVLGGCLTESEIPCNSLVRYSPDGVAGTPRNLPGATGGMAFGAHDLWVSGGPNFDLVRRFRPADVAVDDHSWRVDGATTTDIVEAYGDMWVADIRGRRLLRIDPETNVLSTFDVRTDALGSVMPSQLVVADGALVVATRCCSSDLGHSQIGTVGKDGRLSVFYATKGRLAIASDGTDLWVAAHGRVTRFARSRANDDTVNWHPDRAHDYVMRSGLLFASPGSVWSIAPGAPEVHHIDVRTGKVATIALSGGPVDLDLADAAVTPDGERAWFLDGAQGILYELAER